jgi:hypothetical protein
LAAHDGRMDKDQWLPLVCSALQESVVDKDWSRAFASNGLTNQQQETSMYVRSMVGLTRHTFPTAKPSAAEIEYLLGMKNIPYAQLVPNMPVPLGTRAADPRFLYTEGNKACATERGIGPTHRRGLRSPIAWSSGHVLRSRQWRQNQHVGQRRNPQTACQPQQLPLTRKPCRQRRRHRRSSRCRQPSQCQNSQCAHLPAVQTACKPPVGRAQKHRPVPQQRRQETPRPCPQL